MTMTTYAGVSQRTTYFAAREMLLKDGEKDDAGVQTAAMQALAKRIGMLAPQRDAFRAERVKNVRGQGWRRWG